MEEQVNMFSYVEELNKDPISNSLCVVKDGLCIDISWKELFDDTKYDTLSCITYVSSASFFSKTAGKFDNVKLIIGIEKPDVRKAIAESINSRVMQEGVRFFEELTDNTRQRLINKNLEVRFSKSNCIIHSKFYLLSNTLTGDNRVILGSANLTESAFNNSITQYEDVMVFDNTPLFDTYLNRFKHIYTVTEDYVPLETIQKYREGKLISMADFTPEERTEELIEILKKENIVPICNEEIIQYVQEAQSDSEKEIIETKATFEVIAAVSKKKKGKSGELVIKNSQDLDEAKRKIIDILFRHTKTESSFQRFSMTFNDADKKQYIIFPKNDNEETRSPEVFDRAASPEEIKQSINNINNFVLAYKKFVKQDNNDTEHLSRIFEAIIYSFASTYLFKIRQEIPNDKASIPIMLVIGGRALSGKSKLLAYIDTILSGRHINDEHHFFQYKLINKGSAISDLFQTDNTYPLLVDEVAPAFFYSTSSNKGEELIKYLSNTLNNKHPAMICTTNVSNFQIPPQVSRRIYFLKVDSCFDDKFEAESKLYYSKIISEANNLLFRDFCYRMGEKIREGEAIIRKDTRDFLSVIRDLFIEYYQISDISLPDYFPSELYDDYRERGKNMWRTLYVRSKEKFIYSPRKNKVAATLTINLKDLTSTSSNNRGGGDAQMYLNYLRPDILKEEAGIYVILKSEPFFEWIGVKRGFRWNVWSK